MQIYLVGGAVRDELLGLPVKERDWVVVGASVEEMLKQGYRQVGKDFPVFLHPKTKEEYALARMERKVGRGYTGFTFDTSPDVSLEEDLKRRDITINAIAKTDKGEIVDPYHGQKDIKAKLLRHVSDAFVEDPVRILRVARFAARFASMGFTVAPETMELMKSMAQSGEVDALVAERVWKELERALTEPSPEQFFQVLKNCDALDRLFPAALPLDALQRAVHLSSDAKIRFAALLHHLTESEIKILCDRYRIPSDYRELALLVGRFFKTYHQPSELSAENILDLFHSVDAYRRPERFRDFLLVCEACETTVNLKLLQECFNATRQVTANNYLHLSGKEIGAKIFDERKAIIEHLLNQRHQR